VAKGDPPWWSSSTVAGEQFIVKFAWPVLPRFASV
jgi:hypothetical protein